MVGYSLLHIAQFPSFKELQLWQNLGIYCLLNVSGINLYDIYDAISLAPFDIEQIPLVDFFTSQPNMDAISHAQLFNSYLYCQHACEQQQQALLAAVDFLSHQLTYQVPTTIFCHRGLGRSPLVVAAALQRFYGESPAQAIARTRAVQPHALFSEVSLSALHWCASQGRSHAL